jgi:hypothetical protein
MQYLDNTDKKNKTDGASITKFTILGERCSGTNLLQKIIETNFELEYSNDFHHKHFFGFCNYSKNPETNNTLFICIVRNVYEWCLSLFEKQHNLRKTKYFMEFCTQEVHSFDDNEKEIVCDWNPDTGTPYKNIFEMRKAKILFMKKKLPVLVQHTCVVLYENLSNSIFQINFCSKIHRQFPIKKKLPEFVSISYDAQVYAHTNGKYKKVYAPKKYRIKNSDLAEIENLFDKDIEATIGYNVDFMKKNISVISDENSIDTQTQIIMKRNKALKEMLQSKKYAPTVFPNIQPSNTLDSNSLSTPSLPSTATGLLIDLNFDTTTSTPAPNSSINKSATSPPELATKAPPPPPSPLNRSHLQSAPTNLFDFIISDQSVQLPPVCTPAEAGACPNNAALAADSVEIAPASPSPLDAATHSTFPNTKTLVANTDNKKLIQNQKKLVKNQNNARWTQPYIDKNTLFQKNSRVSVTSLNNISNMITANKPEKKHNNMQNSFHEKNSLQLSTPLPEKILDNIHHTTQTELQMIPQPQRPASKKMPCFVRMNPK